MSPHNDDTHEDHGHRAPLTAFFFFPYFSGDDGTRPLPSFVTSYHCPSLLVNEQPFNWNPLMPGETIRLSAVVANLGALPAHATVTFLWAPWSAQFSQNLTWIGQVGGFWQSSETKTTQPVVWNVPATIPEHVCLLANVDSILDVTPQPPSLSVTDRQYAQQNLAFRAVQPGATMEIPIIMGNPDARARSFRIRVRPDTTPSAEFLATDRNLRLHLEAAKAMRPLLHPSHGKRLAQDITLRLPGRSEQRCALKVEVPKSLQPGAAVLLVVEQFDAMGEMLDPVGSAGILLAVAPERQ